MLEAGNLKQNTQIHPFPIYPDSKVHGTKMGPTWVLSAPDEVDWTKQDSPDKHTSDIHAAWRYLIIVKHILKLVMAISMAIFFDHIVTFFVHQQFLVGCSLFLLSWENNISDRHSLVLQWYLYHWLSCKLWHSRVMANGRRYTRAINCRT